MTIFGYFPTIKSIVFFMGIHIRRVSKTLNVGIPAIIFGWILNSFNSDVQHYINYTVSLYYIFPSVSLIFQHQRKVRPAARKNQKHAEK
jgi:hypothetical protein